MGAFVIVAAAALTALPSGFKSAALRVRTNHGEASVDLSSGAGENAWYRAELTFDSRRLRLRVTTLAETTVYSEALEIGFAHAEVEVTDRAYRFLRLRPGERAHQDAWSPHAIRVGKGDAAIFFPGYDSFPSVEIERFAVDDTRVRLELDHAANHPHFSYDCVQVKKPKSPRFGFAFDPAQSIPRRDLSALRRRAGETRVFEARYLVGGSAVTAPAVWKARQPYPFRATIIFTDHADQALYARIRAVLYGDSSRERAAGSGGFIGHKLPLTKTVFTRNDGGSLQLANRDYFAMAKDAVAHGIEFGPHTVTASRDTREQTAAGLATFAELGATTWIDHSPLTNCEAIGNQGWNPASPYFVLDILKARGYRALWAPVDIVGGEEHLNMFRPEELSWRRVVLFEHPRVAPGFWLFATHRVFDDFDRVGALFSRGNLDRFTRERGVEIAHSYLDFHRPTSGYNFRSWLVQRGREYALKPEANNLLRELARRRDAGEVWVATIRDFIDYAVAARDVVIDLDESGATTVENRSGRDLPAFQLVRSTDGASISVPLKRGDRVTVSTP